MANVILYTVALVMLPGVFGADANILVLTLFGTLVTFTFLLYCTGVEYLKVRARGRGLFYFWSFDMRRMNHLM